MFKQVFYPSALSITFFMAISFSEPLFANTRANTFIDNGNGTVTDTTTGLTWQQEIDINEPAVFSEASQFCANLVLAGSTDWRLPRVKELISIVDYRLTNPAIDDRFFPNTNNGFYWTTTPDGINPSLFRIIAFSNGISFSSNSGNLNYRCVR